MVQLHGLLLTEQQIPHPQPPTPSESPNRPPIKKKKLRQLLTVVLNPGIQPTLLFFCFFFFVCCCFLGVGTFFPVMISLWGQGGGGGGADRTSPFVVVGVFFGGGDFFPL